MQYLKYLILYAFFTTCRNADDQLPEKVTQAFIKAMQQRDYRAAKKLATSGSGSLLDAVASSGQNLFPVQAENSYKIGVPIIKSDSCFISIIVAHRPYPVKILLLKKSGSWKVAYDLPSIFQLNE